MLKIGQKALHFALNDNDGKDIAFDDFGGKLVILIVLSWTNRIYWFG